MITNKRNSILLLYKLSGLAIFLLSLFLAMGASRNFLNHHALNVLLEARFGIRDLVVLVILLYFWYLLSSKHGLFGSMRLFNYKVELKSVMLTCLWGSSITSATLLLTHPEITNWMFPVYMICFSLLVAVSSRFLMRFMLFKLRLRGHNIRRMLIVGTNQRAMEFVDRLLSKPEYGYRVIGFMDDIQKNEHPHINLLGPLKDFTDVITTKVVDEVTITLPMKSHYDEISQIVQAAEEQGIVVHILSDLFITKVARHTVGRFSNFSFLSMYSGPQRGMSLMAKRVMDVAIVLPAILILMPVFIAIALAIKLTSKGPVLFLQKRIGKNKRPFKLFKFRTMRTGAEKEIKNLMDQNEMDGPVFKIRNDPRITSIGRFLRKTSLDELPQLFNVLLGDISIVGPRPLPFRDYKGFNQNWQRRRFSVLPGITCTWQISGRNNISFDDWMRLDLEYIDNWCLSRDIKIMFATVPAVLTMRGAS